ncbi:hypothetical protein [Capnocytophaga canis]|uniref:Uncharacterized protein n=1 Tax=Capnocytophaga canis TaxID=1848903 RepID=A0A0B7I0P2_9FLAO|nr:hypothetical protein [Capnocytophaga canis]CEN45561.1 exported hypothetical protein [Capnocytophaga canis]
MKKIYLLFLIFVNISFSQEYTLLDKQGIAVSYAHLFLDDVFFAYSDEKGKFNIPQKPFEKLEIQHISFQTKTLKRIELPENKQIVLEENTFVLSEVEVSSPKKRKRKTLLPEKSLLNTIMEKADIQLIYTHGSNRIEYSFLPTVYESVAVYIPNNKSDKKTFIKKIILESEDKQSELDTLYIPFRVNLMSYDTIANLPKEKIRTEDWVVGKRVGERVEIEVDKSMILEFPKEGICVMVSVYATEFYIAKRMNPPRFDAVAIRKSSKFREYSYDFDKYCNTWREMFYSEIREQCFNFGIEIEYQD